MLRRVSDCAGGRIPLYISVWMFGGSLSKGQEHNTDGAEIFVDLFSSRVESFEECTVYVQFRIEFTE